MESSGTTIQNLTDAKEFQHLSDREKRGFANYQKAVEAWQNSYYIDYPQQVHIETQTVCNAKCVFCPYVELERQGQRMSDELFMKIVNDLTAIPNNVPFTVCPFKVSDPILEKRLPDMIDVIQGKLPNASIHIATNGQALSEKKIESLASTRRPININISLNDHRPEVYEPLMSLKFDRTVANLEVLHERFVRGEFPHTISIGRVSGNREDDVAFLDWVSAKFPQFRVTIKPSGNWMGSVSSRTHEAVLPIGCLAWFQASIMATGDVALCCMDAYGETTFGNVATSSVLDIYNSPAHREHRESKSRLGLSICSKCTYPETSSESRVPLP